MAGLYDPMSENGTRRWAPSHTYSDARDADEMNPGGAGTKKLTPEPVTSKVGQRKAPAGSIEEKVEKKIDAKQRGLIEPTPEMKKRYGLK